MKRQDRLAQERREWRKRWIAAAAVTALLAVGLVVGAFALLAPRVVLVPAQHVDAVVRQTIEGLGQKQPDTVDCPDEDLRTKDKIVCNVRFTDGSEAKLRFGVTGKPGDVTPTIEGV